jgi:Importin repeat
MLKVINDAFVAQDEVVLEDALVEFNELAEIEPAFFKPYFVNIYSAIKPIIDYKDFANSSIRQQPLEFVVTLVERKPSLAQKDIALLKDMLEQIFKLMIDIDEDIDSEWLKPKEGF